MKMKSLVFGAFLAAAVALAPVTGFAQAAAKTNEAAAAPATGKGLKGFPIGVVDMGRVLATSEASKDIRSQSEAKIKSIEASLKEQEKKLRAEEESLIKQKATLKPEEFKAKAEDFRKKLIEAQKSALENRNMIEKSVDAAVKNLEKQAGEIVAQEANKHGFAIVLSREGIVLAEKSLDITDEVLKQLNAKVTKVPVKWTK